jgi:hypothetical protein
LLSSRSRDIRNRNHRLMLLCLGLTAMPSARSAARLQSAAKYVDTQMTPAYLVVAAASA